MSDLHTFMDLHIRAPEASFGAHQVATEQLIRALQDQFQSQFYQSI